MRKILTFLMLLTFAMTAWAGEKTITISRNDVDWESANTVYNISKGGVQLVMSGGMNNPNFLLMKQQTHITIKSANYNIKRIVFHCLDENVVEDGTFYNGPKTMDVAQNITLGTIPGRYTAPYNNNNFDGCWTSTYNGTLSGHTKYPDGFPAGYELMFENGPRPIRFASIDIVLEQETGDVYELVTNDSQLNENVNYMLVGRTDALTTKGRALSHENTLPSTPYNGNIKSTEVELLENGRRVKANESVQFIHLGATGDSNFPWYLRANNSESFKTGTDKKTGTSYNNGYQLILQTHPTSNATSRWYFFTSIHINGSDNSPNYENNAVIKFYNTSTANTGGINYGNCQIRHNNDNNQFRNIEDNSSIRQNVYLYKPSQQYKITTEVQPGSSYGTISLRDGVLVDNGINWSQKMETVQFLVTPANGKKIASVTIAYDDDETTTITPLTVSPSINGTLYTFEMPGHNVHITVTFADVEYHNVNMVVKPKDLCGNIFLTEGYVVQQDQVKSYEGQNIVFNVISNPINQNNGDDGYYELSYVTVKDHATNVETTLVPDAQGNYTFTMPDNEVTITAYFYDTTKSPLWLIGTANGGDWHPYGPRFNYDNETDEYYIDVYFKGTGDYGSQTGNNWGEFRVTWKINAVGDEDWSKIQNQRVQGCPWEADYRLSDGQTYGMCYDNDKQDLHFTVDPGVYRIKVGTEASQNKGYLAQNNVQVNKIPVTLAFNPAGGADAASAVEVPQNQLVSLVGDLYTKVKAINPNEADANFMYKATKTVAGNATTETENATTATSNISVLDVVNDGETVTQLDGWNYLGWIVANNTAYYKVTETPLHWIEEFGEKDKTYTVSDRLQGVYAQGSSLWCKDLGDISIVKTVPYASQVDYLASTLTTTNHLFPDAMRIGNWDQSNWVELDFSGFGASGNAMASALVNNYIQEKTITGVYTDDVNYTIKVTSTPVADGDASYVPNTYCVSNFLESNLTLKDGDTGPSVTKDGTTTYYYFLNPKIQEYAIITYAMWDKDNQIMIIPDNNPFNGAACIGRWDLNDVGDQLSALDAAFDAPETCHNEYEFHIIVQRTNKNYGSPISGGAKAGADAPSGKTDQTASDVIRTQPLDLQASSPLPTAITRVGTEAQVVGVEYVNIAGMCSSKPWQGVNIVVTRYSDGSTTTTKVVK